jgi:hypothetical protein
MGFGWGGAAFAEGVAEALLFIEGEVWVLLSERTHDSSIISLGVGGYGGQPGQCSSLGRRNSGQRSRAPLRKTAGKHRVGRWGLNWDDGVSTILSVDCVGRGVEEWHHATGGDAVC